MLRIQTRIRVEQPPNISEVIFMLRGAVLTSNRAKENSNATASLVVNYNS
jgi:hypothetical protein